VKNLVINKVSRLTWKKYVKKKTPQFIGASIVAALLVVTILLSEGIDLTVDHQNLDPQYLLLILVSSLAFLLLLGGILKLFLFGNLQGMGIKSEERGIEIIRLLFFSTMIILFVTGLFCLLDVSLPEAYLQLAPVLLIRFILDSSKTQITDFSELVGQEFYQTARNAMFGVILTGIIILLIISLVTVLTKFGRSKIFQLLQKSETFSELTEEQVTQSDITLIKMVLFILLPPLGFYVFNKIQNEVSLSVIVGNSVLIIIGLIWLYVFIKTIDDLFLKGAKFAPKVIFLNLLFIVPILLCFWIFPLILAGFTEMYIISDSTDLNILISFFVSNLFDFETVVIYDFILCVALASVFIGMAEGATISSFIRSIKNGIDIPQSGDVSSVQAPRVSILTKYTVMLGIWFNVLLVNLEPVWDTLKLIFSFDWPTFPFISLFDWIKESFITSVEQFIQSQLGMIASIILPLTLLVIPLYFILATSFKFMSITLYTSKVRGLSTFTALISTTFVLILVELLNDLWAMETLNDVPLRVLEELAIFSNTMVLVKLFESVFFFIGIPLGAYLILKRSPWKGTKVNIENSE